jgi:hypothetical protein
VARGHAGWELVAVDGASRDAEEALPGAGSRFFRVGLVHVAEEVDALSEAERGSGPPCCCPGLDESLNPPAQAIPTSAETAPSF